MRGKLTAVLMLFVLFMGVGGGTLALGGCGAVTTPDEVSPMEARELPRIDLVQPDSFETATFALG